jgi:hypothetical protein
MEKPIGNVAFINVISKVIISKVVISIVEVSKAAPKEQKWLNLKFQNIFRPNWIQYTYSVTPSLIGWSALMMPPVPG